MKLSVAICTYNGSLFLEKQLISILTQTILVDEIIICDDNSTDGTINIIKLYQNKYKGLIYLHENKKPLGTIKNFEKAIALTTGDLIFLADQDDIWHLDKVEKMKKYFQLNENCQLLFTNANLIDGNGEQLVSTLWDKWGFDEEKKASWKKNVNAFADLIIGNNKITGATVCFHKKLKKVIFPFSLPLGYWHDGWVALHAASVKGLFFLNESLIYYRIHSNQQVGLSNDVSKMITLNANKNFISKQKFFNRLKKQYPNLKEYIPCDKKSFYMKLSSKFKFHFKRFFINEK